MWGSNPAGPYHNTYLTLRDKSNFYLTQPNLKSKTRKKNKINTFQWLLLRLDSLAGSMELTFQLLQTTNPLLARTLTESPELCLVLAKPFSLLLMILLMSHSIHSSAAVDTSLNVFSYDAVWSQQRTHKPSPAPSGCCPCYPQQLKVTRKLYRLHKC